MEINRLVAYFYCPVLVINPIYKTYNRYNTVYYYITIYYYNTVYSYNTIYIYKLSRQRGRRTNYKFILLTNL